LPGEIDGDATVPLLRIDFLHSTRRTGDSRVVHQAVESAQVLHGVGEQRRDLRAVGHVAAGPGQRGIAAAKSRERALIHVAHVDARAFTHERACNLESDPRRPGGDQYTQSGDSHVHGQCSLI